MSGTVFAWPRTHGRVTLMLWEIVVLAADGERVGIVARTRTDAEKLRERAIELGAPADNVVVWMPPYPTLPPSSRQRGTVTAKAVHDRRPSSADETDLRDDGGMT